MENHKVTTVAGLGLLMALIAFIVWLIRKES